MNIIVLLYYLQKIFTPISRHIKKVKINLRTRILHNLLNQPQMQFSQSQSDFCCNNTIFTRETKLKVITNDAEWIYSSQEGDLNTKTVTATFFASVQYETNQ